MALFNLVPVSSEMQELLKVYGIERHMMAYFNREEPSRIYVNVYGQLHFIDLSTIYAMNGAVAQCTVEALPVVELEDSVGNGIQNLALRACELARDDPIVRNDLENELNKVIQRVLSNLAGKRSKNDTALSTNLTKCSNVSAWQTLTDSEREVLQRERRKRNAYKTSLCRSFRESSTCPYGKECVFAHGEKELRLPPQAHPKYKTQLCNKFSVWNYCPYGARCQYIHQRVSEISRVADENLKIKRDSKKTNENSLSSTTSQHPSSKHLILRRTNKRLSIDLFTSDCSSYNSREFHLNTDDAASSTVLNQFYVHFNNMKVEDNSNTFSQSCFSRIRSEQVE
ncbi:unnamed protein product [Litomosoides sigmodontis]|uniref:C3H1-type domain-containing protein n=1 Tax=Litomosoides sigmodontis TaxID=42156 RepID=A0A3P6SL49_LITSI|nr:unnamed protein product [Litomosoides sigmodontis]